MLACVVRFTKDRSAVEIIKQFESMNIEIQQND
jgi:hypothetical protein